MPTNRYAPPTSEVRLPTGVAARPLSVWLLLLALCAALVLFLVGVVNAGAQLLQSGPALFNQHSLLWSFAWRFVAVAVVICTFFSVLRRYSLARWLGLVCIFSLAVLIAVIPDQAQYASSAERGGGRLTRLVAIPVFCAWWAYSFAFSAKARRYFSQAPAP